MTDWAEANSHYSEMVEDIEHIVMDLVDVTYTEIHESLRMLTYVLEDLVAAESQTNDHTTSVDSITPVVTLSQMKQIGFINLDKSTQDQITNSGMRYEWFPNS
jgi:predicted acetyltransferase